MNEILKRITETLLVILGNCLYAFGVAMFIIPGGLITGGYDRYRSVCGGCDGTSGDGVCVCV